MIYRCNLDGIGTFVGRKFRHDRDASVVMRATQTRLELLLDKIPHYLRHQYEELCRQTVVVLVLLGKISMSQAEKAIEEAISSFSEELMDLVKEIETLSSSRKMNWFVDAQVSDLLDLLKIFASSRSPKAKPAEMLKNLWFKKESLNFIQYSSSDQWLEIDRRFTGLTEEQEAAIDDAGVRPFVDDLRLANGHLGQLLGITKATMSVEDKAPTKEERAEAMDSFNTLMSRIVVFANMAWQTKETEEYKKTLLEPYLERIADNNRKAAKRRKKQAKSNPKTDGPIENMFPAE